MRTATARPAAARGGTRSLLLDAERAGSKIGRLGPREARQGGCEAWRGRWSRTAPATPGRGCSAAAKGSCVHPLPPGACRPPPRCILAAFAGALRAAWRRGGRRRRDRRRRGGRQGETGDGERGTRSLLLDAERAGSKKGGLARVRLGKAGAGRGWVDGRERPRRRPEGAAAPPRTCPCVHPLPSGSGVALLRSPHGGFAWPLRSGWLNLGGRLVEPGAETGAVGLVEPRRSGWLNLGAETGADGCLIPRRGGRRGRSVLFFVAVGRPDSKRGRRLPRGEGETGAVAGAEGAHERRGRGQPFSGGGGASRRAASARARAFALSAARASGASGSAHPTISA